MKAVNLFTVLMALATITFFSCNKSEVNNEVSTTQKSMSELQTDAKFSWETTRNVEVRLLANTSGVVYIRPVDGDFYFFKGFLTAGKQFTAKIVIPTYVTKVKLTYNRSVYEITINGDHLDFTF